MASDICEEHLKKEKEMHRQDVSCINNMCMNVYVLWCGNVACKRLSLQTVGSHIPYSKTPTYSYERNLDEGKGKECCWQIGFGVWLGSGFSGKGSMV